MNEVVCWCCEYFVLLENAKTHNEIFAAGKCKNKGVFCHSGDRVCEDFVLRKGLHTVRTIPTFCKNNNNIQGDK